MKATLWSDTLGSPNDRLTLLKATATPLASIFGSGFLIVVPVLEESFGRNAAVAMLAVCVLAYLVGNASRHNIVHSEGALPEQIGAVTVLLRTACTGIIVIAYTISVALYLQIMSSYALNYLDMDTTSAERLVSTVAATAIVLLGVSRGFGGLSTVEYVALGTTLAMISVMLVVFLDDVVQLAADGNLQLPGRVDTPLLEQAQLLGGILIAVQVSKQADTWGISTRKRCGFSPRACLSSFRV